MKRILTIIVVASLGVLPTWAYAQDASNADLQAQLNRLQQATQQQSSPTGQQTLPTQAEQENQQQAAVKVPTTNEQESLQQEVFANSVNSALPLKPNQIRQLKALFDATQRAAAASAAKPPRPTSTSMLVNLSPGATPPDVRMGAGFVSSLVFLDATGAPWPIQSYDIGDPQAFNVQWNKKGNTLLVQAITHYKIGNLAVMLKGLDTPIMVTLMPGQHAVDYRVDLRVPGLGPNATTSARGLPTTANAQLLNVLNNIQPYSGMEKNYSVKSMNVKGCGSSCLAWLVTNKATSHQRLFLRTRLTVLSPGWISTMSSGDGTHAYELPPAPIILASRHGKSIQLVMQNLQ